MYLICVDLWVYKLLMMKFEQGGINYLNGFMIDRLFVVYYIYYILNGV